MSTVSQFPVLSCPPLIRQVADDYSDLLGSHYSAFAALLCGTVFGVGVLSNIFRFFMFSPSVSTLDRLLNDGDIWQKLNRRHRRRILRFLPKLIAEPERYMWAIDDTLIERSGKNIWGTYWWHDHSTDGYVFAQKVLVLGLVDRKRKILIPVFWEVLHREDNNDKTKIHEKGWQVAVKLLQQAITAGFPKLLVVTDSWFAGEEFFSSLRGLGFSFVIEIKSNRRVVKHGHQQLYARVDEFFKSRSRHKIFYHGVKKWAAEAILLFNEGKQKMRAVAVANRKGLVEEAFTFYVTYELTWDAAKLWAASRDRWAIEVQFRELKQLFTLGEVAVQSRQAVETSISVAAIALTMIRIEQLAQADTKSENQYVRPIPAGAIVRDIQLQSLTRSISKLATNDSTDFKKFTTRINQKNFGRKPTGSHRTIQTRSAGDFQRKVG